MDHHNHITRYFFCFYPLAFSCFLLFLFIYISLLVMVILYSVLLFFSVCVCVKVLTQCVVFFPVLLRLITFDQFHLFLVPQLFPLPR